MLASAIACGFRRTRLARCWLTGVDSAGEGAPAGTPPAGAQPSAASQRDAPVEVQGETHQVQTLPEPCNISLQDHQRKEDDDHRNVDRAAQRWDQPAHRLQHRLGNLIEKLHRRVVRDRGSESS
jgi:hypothetical protein